MTDPATRAGTAHGKLLLFGEHAAVHGYAACGVSLEQTMSVRIEGPPDGRWVLEGIGDEHREAVTAFLETTRALFPPAVGWGGTVRVFSDIPLGVGLGSSAAWCAAFCRALLGPSIGDDALWEIAHRAEAFFHGTPSGIDTGLAILDGMFAFYPRPPGLPRAQRLAGVPLPVVVGVVPRRESTKALVASLRQRISSGDTTARDAIAELGDFSERAVTLLDAPERTRPSSSTGPRRATVAAPAGAATPTTPDIRRLHAIGRLADEAHRTLRALGLSTPLLDSMIETGRNAGALGGKVSGAGGGGTFYLVCGSEREQRTVAEALIDEAGRNSALRAGSVFSYLFRPAPPHATAGRS